MCHQNVLRHVNLIEHGNRFTERECRITRVLKNVPRVEKFKLYTCSYTHWMYTKNTSLLLLHMTCVSAKITNNQIDNKQRDTN